MHRSLTLTYSVVILILTKVHSFLLFFVKENLIVSMMFYGHIKCYIIVIKRFSVAQLKEVIELLAAV